ncbi:hypothetical protein ACJIZ3_013162 [Penstemon smallii]|uniref:Uncharacterized protein n=1 Tax=Penstemon smallii TaxID=265156 RepID=A0ABD3UQC6_9LAMI
MGLGTSSVLPRTEVIFSLFKLLFYDFRSLSIYSIIKKKSQCLCVIYLRVACTLINFIVKLLRIICSSNTALPFEPSKNLTKNPMVKLFDSHCHLQDSRIYNVAPKLIQEALDTGVTHFAVNGVSEKDWYVVKEMSDRHSSIIPNFGLHPWFISERTPDWLNTLKQFLTANPCAAVGEIGLDKGSMAKHIDYTDQVEVFRLQLQLAKEFKRPASVHCVSAFGDLLEILESTGPFPAGIVLHSYIGSAEMVPEFSKLNAYFSFSGHLMSMKESKAKQMLKSVPFERILLETDAPDARPKSVDPKSLFLINESDDVEDGLSLPAESLNHPANIHHILAYVSGLLEMEEEDLARMSYENAVRVFSYESSKLVQEGEERH